MLRFSSGAQFDGRRFRPRSWAQKYRKEIGLALLFTGVAAWSAAQHFKLAGSLGMVLRVFGTLAMPFSLAFLLERGPIFPPSPVNSTNRWKYLTLLGILWLIILPIAWWFAVRALGK